MRTFLVTKMKNQILKNLVLFIAGFCLYITIETIFRGYSFTLMGCCGGLCVVVLDKINDHISWNLDLFWQALCGSLLITFMELVIGIIAKYSDLLPVMWNYSNIPFNFLGIICLPFSIAWLFISVIAIFLADAINYYIFEDTAVPHYILFGGVYTIVFHIKKCDKGGNHND